MNRYLSLSGCTRTGRHQAIADIEQAIFTAGGWIIDHTLLSNKAIALRFCLPAESVERFLKDLDTAGIRLDSRPAAGTPAAFGGGGGETELTVSLNVSFIHDQPDLTHEVPAVPG
jgi:hypothetical protein